MFRTAKYYSFGLVLFGGVFFAAPAQAAVTQSQANAIVLLLMSFGADDATIANVWRSLVGGGQVPMQPGVTGSVSFVSGARPDNTSVLAGSSSVPFTTLVLSNSTNAPATVHSITVEQSGKGADSNIENVLLLDAAGNAVGAPKELANSQANVGDGFVLAPGQTLALTVAANIAERARGGQIQLEVVAVNASVPVSGSLPLAGSVRTVKRSR